MKRGQTDRQTDRLTLRLLDQLGPEGRVGENIQEIKKAIGCRRLPKYISSIVKVSSYSNQKTFLSEIEFFLYLFLFSLQQRLVYRFIVA